MTFGLKDNGVGLLLLLQSRLDMGSDSKMSMVGNADNRLERCLWRNLMSNLYDAPLQSVEISTVNS